MLTINFVYDTNAVIIKKILKDVEYDDIINYIDITNKLIKNDIYSVEPTDFIISSYIMKYLEKSIVQKHSENIYYVLLNFSEEVIMNVADYIYEIFDRHSIDEEFKFKLNITEERLHIFE